MLGTRTSRIRVVSGGGSAATGLECRPSSPAVPARVSPPRKLAGSSLHALGTHGTLLLTLVLGVGSARSLTTPWPKTHLTHTRPHLRLTAMSWMENDLAENFSLWPV